MMPSVTSGSPITALAEAVRRWQASASSKPPPKAKPFMAATTGLGQLSTVFISFWPRSASGRACSGVCLASSPMSAPATKAFSPAPVTMTARTAVSAPTASKQCCSSPIVASFSALSLSGRLTVTKAMPSRSLRRMFS
jgi:hypothetical protein